MKILKIENLTKVYGNKGNITHALNGLNIEMEKGEFVGIMGASGSGKTTLLNCISTIDRPSSGEIRINNQEITNLKESALSKFRRDELGFIFQDFNLLDTLTAYENISLALSIQHKSAKEIDERIKEISRLLDIEDVLEKFPYQMSGGQKQRVASARAIITNPSLILADEPTGALDSKSAHRLLDSISILNENYQSSILMVTHDAFTASFCSRIIFIKDGQVFSELNKGDLDRKTFFNRIIEVVSVLGGEL